jgi:hypothetical protein
MDPTPRRANYYYSAGIFSMPYKKSFNMNFTYNKPFNAPYKPHSEIGMVGTISSSYRAKRKKI